MSALKSLWLLPAALVATAALAAYPTPPAQQPSSTPSTGSPDPSAASSPHQREATGAQGAEAPTTGGPDPADASSPHQREATGMSAHESMGKDADDASAAAKSPQTFVEKAALTGLTEVELGKVALKKSQDSQVRTFAQRMITDHGKANDELSSIADRKQLQVPKKLDSEHQSMVTELSGKSGTDFDAAYAQHMAEGHGKAVALFEAEAQASDSDLSSFASKTLPTLKEHKQLADKLSANMRSASAESSSSNR